MATVAALTYYPVKGLRGIAVAEAEVGETGLAHDREFMLVDPQDGTFHSQRTLPAMAAIAVAYEGAGLLFTTGGAEELAVEVTEDGPRRDVSLFGKWFGSGIAQDLRAEKWFTEVLGQPATLVRVAPDHDRPGWGMHPGKAGFADAHALLVTSLASLDELNARILETGGEPVPMNRFRPNIVVGGWSGPHTEDRVLEATIGGAVRIGYSEDSAHRLHAGGDVLIHGSRFEPCGLTQLYALRFGTIPVVRPVGGLADTIVHADKRAISDGTANGFHFEQPSAESMMQGIDQACGYYYRPNIWGGLQKTAMSIDFSWERSAQRYLEVYQRIAPRRFAGMFDEKAIEDEPLSPRSRSSAELGEQRS